jgi:NADH:ubiquinone oxidoreductase subunit 6 (subunit J)
MYIIFHYFFPILVVCVFTKVMFRTLAVKKKKRRENKIIHAAVTTLTSIYIFLIYLNFYLNSYLRRL